MARGRDRQARVRVACPAAGWRPAAAGWVLVVREVTEERESRQHAVQRQRLAAAGQPAAGIAHDLNILPVILLHTRLIMSSPHALPLVRQCPETIADQSERAAELVWQMADFGRQTVLEWRPIDLLPLLQEQVTLLERTPPESVQIILIQEERPAW